MVGEADDLMVDGIVLRMHYGSFSRGKVTSDKQIDAGLGSTTAYHGGSKAEATDFICGKHDHTLGCGPLSPKIRHEFANAIQDALLVAASSKQQAARTSF